MVETSVLREDLRATVAHFDLALYHIGRLNRLAPEGSPARCWADCAAGAVRFLTEAADACISKLQKETAGDLSDGHPLSACDKVCCACGRR